MNPLDLVAKRGEVWDIRFDPSEGDEIKKIRPAVVMTASGAGRMHLHIVVPITGWQPQFARYFWMAHILPVPTNGLSKESAADVFQLKSVAFSRFQNKRGALTNAELDEIAAAIALCVGYNP